MIDFNDFDIEETKYNIGKIPYEYDRSAYKKYIGRYVIIRDDSEYCHQNPLDENGNKVPGVIIEQKEKLMDFIVKWDIYYYQNSYNYNDLLLV